jgi:hypothetical protein
MPNFSSTPLYLDAAGLRTIQFLFKVKLQLRKLCARQFWAEKLSLRATVVAERYGAKQNYSELNSKKNYCAKAIDGQKKEKKRQKKSTCFLFCCCNMCVVDRAGWPDGRTHTLHVFL